jgi:hypothetical protein
MTVISTSHLPFDWPARYVSVSGSDRDDMPPGLPFHRRSRDLRNGRSRRRLRGYRGKRCWRRSGNGSRSRLDKASCRIIAARRRIFGVRPGECSPHRLGRPFTVHNGLGFLRRAGMRLAPEPEDIAVGLAVDLPLLASLKDADLITNLKARGMG